ncbi:hypothetical protein TRAPUB_8812 [Trametes pubescens]|uniref:Uncharacterized protein n=1 Tax=Trametes pubescens TaxID=154538 RepID=A0A1M2W4A3_TRAPU|nr:hypothetical protein TRAPUB_8812 [Trametes pubescens]
MGVDGFFCLIRSNLEFCMMPRWFFSNNSLDSFLRKSRRFNPDVIGVLAELFCLAGSNYLSFIRNPKEKANHLKGEIRDLVAKGLGNETAEMSWAHYVRDIQLKYSVELDSWTHSEWDSVSHLTNSVKQLKTLCDRLQEHKTRWVQISPAQYDTIKSEYEKKLHNGEITSRKKRSNAGKKRKRRSNAGKPRKKGASAGVAARRRRRKTSSRSLCLSHPGLVPTCKIPHWPAHGPHAVVDKLVASDCAVLVPAVLTVARLR